METITKTVWNIDPTHSEIQFKVKHLIISTVTGHFREFEGTVETEGDDFTTAGITFSANTASGHQQRTARWPFAERRIF